MSTRTGLLSKHPHGLLSKPPKDLNNLNGRKYFNDHRQSSSNPIEF
jgi:hypothetical protein